MVLHLKHATAKWNDKNMENIDLHEADFCIQSLQKKSIVTWPGV